MKQAAAAAALELVMGEYLAFLLHVYLLFLLF